MDNRQASYFSSGPTPRPDVNSTMRQHSPYEATSRLEPASRAENLQSRIDQPSRTENSSAKAGTGHPSAAQKSSKEKVQITANGGLTSNVKQTNRNIRNTNVEKGKVHKTLSTKTTTTIMEEQTVKTNNKKVHDVMVTKNKMATGEKDQANVTDIKKKNLTYPIPKPPPTRKAEIFNMETAREIDKKVRKVHAEDSINLKSLSVKLTVRYYKDVEKVRAIFSWICQQKLDELDYSRALTNESPLSALKEVKLKKSSYSELFATMCKSIEIQCHVVTGVAKLENHDIGETEVDKNKVTWNAVYCADGWRIVFFQWAFKTVNLAKIEKLAVKHADKTSESGNSSIPKLPSIENNPSASQTSRATPQQHRHYQALPGTLGVKHAGAQEEEVILPINEYYFLTDPDELIYRCFPDDDSWQLMGKPYSIERFLKLPLLSPAFFENHLKISSRVCGIRKAKNGSCTISIKRLGLNHVYIHHTLSLLDSEEAKLMEDLDLKQLVAVVNEDNKTHFHIRFPISGFYEFKAFGGEHEADTDHLCSFKVNCEEPKLRFEPLPFVPEIGFGPCMVTEHYGLKLVSKVNGLFTIRGPDTVDINFKVLKDIKVTAMMVHHTIPSPDLEEFVHLKLQSQELSITVGVPRNGEYVLKIQAKLRQSTKDFVNVCNFLLTSEDPKKPRKPYETGSDHFVRHQLMETLKTSKNPKDIQNAIDRLNKEDLADDGWLTRAYERLEYLKLARALRNGINRRNADLLDKAIQEAKQSAHMDKLANYVEEGEKMLQEADKNPKYILEMKRTTVSEIHRYITPKPVMFNVMKATYLILGQDPNTVKTWEEIVSLMKYTSRNSLLYKVKHFSKKSLDPDIVEDVNNLLTPHSLEDARAASLGVGTFFQWATDVINGFSKPTQISNMTGQKLSTENKDDT